MTRALPRRGSGPSEFNGSTLARLERLETARSSARSMAFRTPSARVLGLELYLPESWCTEERRVEARIPAKLAFRRKWEIAFDLLDAA